MSLDKIFLRDTILEEKLNNSAVLGVVTQWLSKLGNLRWLHQNLEPLLTLRKDSKLDHYFTQVFFNIKKIKCLFKDTLNALSSLNNLRNEIDVVLKFLQIFEEPIKMFQVFDIGYCKLLIFRANQFLHFTWFGQHGCN